MNQSAIRNPQSAIQMALPIIFIHYGDAEYLRWTLRAARTSNPDKRIVLLGDSSNRKFAKGVAEHILFEELEQSDWLKTFDQVFQVIQGTRHRFTKLHGTEFWLRFVFRRWFLIHRFLEREGIDAFWTFDSDTLVLAPLGKREARFKDYDCTEQCRGECLNGYVGSRGLVEEYIDTINNLFQDQSYLELQRERLKTHMGLAFNEMDAYREFRTRAQLRTIRASEPIDGEVFDDALAFVEDYASASDRVVKRTEIKQLILHPSKAVYGKHRQAGVVRFLTLNMSWMPTYLFKRLSRMALAVDAAPMSDQIEFDAFPSLNVSEPLSLRFSQFYWGLRRRVLEKALRRCGVA